MRIAFFIVCLAAIGVALVQIRTGEARVRHATLLRRNYCDVEISRRVWMQEAEIARLASFRQVSRRGEPIVARLNLIDRTQRDAVAKGLQVPEPPRIRGVPSPSPARRETPPPQRNDRPVMKGR